MDFEEVKNKLQINDIPELLSEQKMYADKVICTYIARQVLGIEPYYTKEEFDSAIKFMRLFTTKIDTEED